MSKENILKTCSWGLSALVSLLAVAAWSDQRLNGARLSLYDWFPLFGLLAFSLMWTHYIAGSIRRHLGVNKKVNKQYLKITSILVLALILMHPLMLNIQLIRDGFGTPPSSYEAVYPESLRGVISLGMIGLLIFLAFEAKRWLSGKSWWRFLDYAQVLAMVIIFYHGLTLGAELAGGWFRFVWYIYGLSLLLSVGYNYWHDKQLKGGLGERS